LEGADRGKSKQGRGGKRFSTSMHRIVMEQPDTSITEIAAGPKKER